MEVEIRVIDVNGVAKITQTFEVVANNFMRLIFFDSVPCNIGTIEIITKE